MSYHKKAICLIPSISWTFRTDLENVYWHIREYSRDHQDPVQSESFWARTVSDVFMKQASRVLDHWSSLLQLQWSHLYREAFLWFYICLFQGSSEAVSFRIRILWKMRISFLAPFSCKFRFHLRIHWSLPSSQVTYSFVTICPLKHTDNRFLLSFSVPPSYLTHFSY